MSRIKLCFIFLAAALGANQLNHLAIPGRVSLKHFESDGIGFKGGYTTLQTMMGLPLNRHHIPFMDIRYHVFNRGRSAINGGVGYRYNAGGALLGMNAYYDARWTTGQTFSQFGGGLELLSRFIDIRANGYFPVKKSKEVRSIRFVGFAGNSIDLKEKDRLALTGGDAEIGLYFARLGDLKMYAAGGAYKFKRQLCNTKIGWKARLRFSWLDNIWAQFSVQHDRLFKTNFQGTASVSYPFWPKPRQRRWNYFPNFEAMLVQPPERQEILALCDITRIISPNITVIFVDNASSGDGTVENPFPTLLQAQNASTSGDFIYVFEGDGTTTGMDAGITLQSTQEFLGSGVAHEIVTGKGTFTIPPSTGANPTITNLAGSAITLASGVTVRGFNISAPTAHGITGTNVGTCIIDQVISTGAMGSGLTITGSSGTTSLSLTSSKFSSSGDRGAIVSSSGSATFNGNINGNTFASNTTDGFSASQADTSNMTLAINNNTFSSNGSDGIDLTAAGNRFNAELVNNSLTMSGNEGIDINASGSAVVQVLVNTNTIDSPLKDGVNITGNGTSKVVATVSSNTVTTPVGNGIVGVSTSTGGVTLTISQNTIDTPTTSGMSFDTGSGGIMTLTASENTITTPTAHGITIIGSNPNASLTATLSTNTISKPGVHGIRIAGSGSRTYNLTINNNTITGNGAASGFGLSILPGSGSNYTISATNNTITSFTNASSGAAIYVNPGSSGATLSLTAESNTLSSCRYGIDADFSSAITATLSLQSNTFATNTNEDITFDIGSSTSCNANLSNNSGDGSVLLETSGTATFCLRLLQNTASSYALTNTAGTYSVESSDGTIQGVQGSNTGTITPSGTITYVDPNTCTVQ